MQSSNPSKSGKAPNEWSRKGRKDQDRELRARSRRDAIADSVNEA